nr:retrovirus-related Pol polyprotein from transposon TNT 1-94 [Tanacetum cinerariifolium]
MSVVIDEINEGNGACISSHTNNATKRLFLEMFHPYELQDRELEEIDDRFCSINLSFARNIIQEDVVEDSLRDGADKDKGKGITDGDFTECPWVLYCTNEAEKESWINKQVKDNKIDLSVQKYEDFSISDDETIDCAFARFNTFITSLKALDESFLSRNHVRKFLRALPTKWRPKVMAIEESKDLSTLPLDELIANLKVYEVELEKDMEISKNNKEKYKLLTFKARKVLSEKEATSSNSNDEEYAMAETMRIEESLNVKFDKSPPPKSPYLEDDDVIECKIIENQEKVLEIKENEPLNKGIINIKESKDHLLETIKGTGVKTIVYADFDHAGDYVNRKSTSRVCTFMGCCLTSWFSKKQTALAISTTEAEYVFDEKACQQALWMKQALVDYDINLDDIPVLCDNKGAIDLRVARPKIENKDNFELKGQFLKELRSNTFSGLDHKDANEHIEKVLEIMDLFHIPNITIDQVMLRAFLMSLIGAVSRWLRNKPSGLITAWEDLKIKFLRKYCPLARTAKKMEEINNFQQEPDENLYQAWERFKELLMKYPQHYLIEMQEVVLSYNGLDVPTRQILDSRKVIPSKTAADAKVAIQEMVEYSHKWHNGTSRTRSTKTSDGLVAIQVQLNNLGREIKKVNEKVYAA